MTEDDAAGRVSKLPLVIMGTIVLLAVIVTIVLVAFPSTDNFDSGTPEAALQQFIEAALDDDEEAALALLTTESRESCAHEFEERRFGFGFHGDDLRAILEHVNVDGDVAEIQVEFRRSNADDPFDSSTSSFRADYRLVSEAGEWRIARADWPGGFTGCTSVGSP